MVDHEDRHDVVYVFDVELYFFFLNEAEDRLEVLADLDFLCDDDLEELTFNLTTRVKSKTPYQIVGDLIRNNTHIAKQVEKNR